jgi:hypothetical protein
MYVPWERGEYGVWVHPRYSVFGVLAGSAWEVSVGGFLRLAPRTALDREGDCDGDAWMAYRFIGLVC